MRGEVVVCPTLGCGACSAINGNERRPFGEIIEARVEDPDGAPLLEGAKYGYINTHIPWFHENSKFAQVNHIINTPESFVMARSSLRAHCRVVCEYGKQVRDPGRVLILFSRPRNDGTRNYFSDVFLDNFLYKHIQRQIFLAEEAMFESVKAFARLEREDLVAARLVPPADDTLMGWIRSKISNNDPASTAARGKLYNDWLARNSRSTELMAALNKMLAPFNLTLTKELGAPNSLYDHYILRPKEMPWSPPIPTLAPGLREHYHLELQNFRASLEPRRQELAERWFTWKSWESEVVPLQAAWLALMNKQLTAHGVQAYFYTRVPQSQEACWDLRYAAIVNKEALIFANASSDRTYLSSPFLGILPFIRIPAEYRHHDYSEPAPYGHLGYTAPAARTKIRMAVTVPAGMKPGDVVQFRGISGAMQSAVVPRNYTPGMQFMVNSD
jgi:hypothetical protein